MGFRDLLLRKRLSEYNPYAKPYSRISCDCDLAPCEALLGLQRRSLRQQPLFQELLSLTAESKVPLRPGRSEPRKRQRRPPAFPLMIKPRSLLQQELGAA